MAVIDYDKSPNISTEERLKSLADSARRAFDEITGELEELKTKIKEMEQKNDTLGGVK